MANPDPIQDGLVGRYLLTCFLPPGAEAFKRDNPNAEVHFYDTGHFALETHAQEIASVIRDFLARKLDGVNRTKKPKR